MKCSTTPARSRTINTATAPGAPNMPDRPTFQTVNPATGAPGPSYPGHTAKEARDIANAAHNAFHTWRRTTFDDRATLMRKAAATLRDRKDDLAALMTQEMGKTLTDGRA